MTLVQSAVALGLVCSVVLSRAEVKMTKMSLQMKRCLTLPSTSVTYFPVRSSARRFFNKLPLSL